MKTNVMVDLETLGTVPGCVILSIGAVVFDENGRGSLEYYRPIWQQSCREIFMTVDPGTVDWWKNQNEEARAILEITLDKKRSIPIRTALDGFAQWLKRVGPIGDVKVWGNGADFDNAILQVAYDLAGIPLPWKFYNNRCYRTLKNFHPDITLERIGTYHNALDDARSQADHAARLLLRQRDCAAVWGETADDEVGEGVREELQQAGVEGPWSYEHQVDPAGDGVAR